MPSPVGHALGAAAAGWLTAGAPPDRSALLRQVAILAAIGIAPDLDLLVGRHHAESHSLGAAAIAATLATALRWPVAGSRARIWLTVFVAWMSHVLLDGLGADTSAPFGMMVFWPFSAEYARLPWTIFDAISRRYWLAGFWRQNALAVAREVALLAPVAFGVLWLRRRRPQE